MKTALLAIASLLATMPVSSQAPATDVGKKDSIIYNTHTMVDRKAADSRRSPASPACISITAKHSSSLFTRNNLVISKDMCIFAA